MKTSTRRKIPEILILLLAVALWSIGVTDCSHKIARSRSERAAFMRSHPCPANGRKSGACPGYVVDHIIPLACGGADKPSNMQWESIEEGKAKDKWERKGCLHGERTEKSDDE